MNVIISHNNLQTNPKYVWFRILVLLMVFNLNMNTRSFHQLLSEHVKDVPILSQLNCGETKIMFDSVREMYVLYITATYGWNWFNCQILNLCLQASNLFLFCFSVYPLKNLSLGKPQKYYFQNK